MSPEPFVTRQKDEVANARAGTRSPLPAACDLTHQSASHQGHTFGVSVAVHADLEGDFSLPPLDNDMAAVQAEPLRHPVERHWTTVQVGTRDVTSGDAREVLPDDDVWSTFCEGPMCSRNGSADGGDAPCGPNGDDDRLLDASVPIEATGGFDSDPPCFWHER